EVTEEDPGALAAQPALEAADFVSRLGTLALQVRLVHELAAHGQPRRVGRRHQTDPVALALELQQEERSAAEVLEELAEQRLRRGPPFSVAQHPVGKRR